MWPSGQHPWELSLQSRAPSPAAEAAGMRRAAETGRGPGLTGVGSGLLWGYPVLRAAPGVPTTGL